MAESHEGSHLSIGEVLGMLLEEFPDVTISKIRFLESQGLIDPERTAAGYRKFHEEDVELLRVILREQRQNFLPLRVIKNRIDSGEIDPSGEVAAPRSLDDLHDAAAESTGRHPAAGAGVAALQFESGAVVGRSELCSMTRLTDAQVRELEQHGLIQPSGSGGGATYDEIAVQVGRAAGRLLAEGLDVRHLKAWRLSAEREASVFDQLIGPLSRPGSNGAIQSVERRLAELETLGAELRRALVVAARTRRF